jgi:hypothetical protein
MTYRERQIGPYHVFYGLPENVDPLTLPPFGEVSGRFQAFDAEVP